MEKNDIPMSPPSATQEIYGPAPNGVSTNSVVSELDELKKRVEILEKLVLGHEVTLKEKKTITNNYVDTILSKIEILKNIIKQNIGDDDEFISQHLILVESIEEQVKQTGKISDKQFKTLNDIYKKQKRV